MNDRLPPNSEQKGLPAWTKAGYGLTALWMLIVLWITGNDPGHPFYQYIFSVPLAGWIAALVVRYIIRTWRRGQKD